MPNVQKIFPLVAMTSALALAGCQMAGPPQRTASPAQPSGVEGEWVDSEGMISQFSDGRFETTAVDTGDTLAVGTYRYRDQRTVEISGQSVIRQQPISYNCAMVASGQLNCTSSEGQRFVLTRRGSGVS